MVHQAGLVQASGKGALRDAEDEMVAELTAALIAPSVAAQEVAQGSGVEDEELSEMLAKLGIVQGKPLSRAAIVASQTWAELEEQEDVSQALQLDAQEMLMEGEHDIRGGRSTLLTVR